MSGNLYRAHPGMIGGSFWRCDHGTTGYGAGDEKGNPRWEGCAACAAEDPAAFYKFQMSVIGGIGVREMGAVIWLIGAYREDSLPAHWNAALDTIASVLKLPRMP